MKSKIARGGCFLGVVGMLVLLIVKPEYSADETVQKLWSSVVLHAVGTLVFALLVATSGYRLWRLPPLSCLLVFLPSLLVVLNNLPFLGLLGGALKVDRPELIPLFALDSLLIGAFEELAFRGTFFPLLLETRRGSAKQIFVVTFVSSAVFGLVHLVNLFEGAGIVPTVLQVGYSFLIGGMCAIVLLWSGNLALSILLHAVFDFCGGLIPTLGSGPLWDTPTVILTALLGVAVTVWMTYRLIRVPRKNVERLFEKRS